MIRHLPVYMISEFFGVCGAGIRTFPSKVSDTSDFFKKLTTILIAELEEIEVLILRPKYDTWQIHVANFQRVYNSSG